MISALICAQGCGFASDIATKSRSEYFFSLRWYTVPQERPEVNEFLKKHNKPAKKKKVSSLTYTIVSSWPGSAAKHCVSSAVNNTQETATGSHGGRRRKLIR